MRSRGSSGDAAGRSRKAADIGVLCLSVYLLVGPGSSAYSATSVVVAAVTVSSLLILNRSRALAGVVVRNLNICVVSAVLLYLTLGRAMMSAASATLNRSDDLTGRATDIWPVVLAMAAEHPILGVGFGNAWFLEGELSLAVGVEQAHNGYLDVYLQLGLVGCLLLAGVMISWSCGIQRLYKRDPDWGIFGTCVLLATLLYNLTETAFFDVYLGVVMVLLPLAFSGKDAVEQFEANSKERLTSSVSATHSRGLPAWQPASSTVGGPGSSRRARRQLELSKDR